MFYDEEYIDDKIDELKELIESENFNRNKSNNFISYNDLEDSFSHNEIDEAQEMFMDKARKYLSKTHLMWKDKEIIK